MRFYSKLTERELDRILAGKAATSDDFADVAAFLRELRSLEEPPSPSVEGRHLAAIFAEALRRPSFGPGHQIPVPRGRRLANPFRRLAARAMVAAVGLTALAAFGGAAYAGVLPRPIQVEVAHILRHVGIHVPGNSHHSPAPIPHTPRVTPPAGNPPQPGQGSSGQGAGTRGNTQGNDGHGAVQGNTTQTTDGSHGSNQSDTNESDTNRSDTNQSGDSQSGDSQSGDSQSGDSGRQNTATNGNQEP